MSRKLRKQLEDKTEKIGHCYSGDPVILERKTGNLKGIDLSLFGEKEKIELRFEHDVLEKPEHTEVEFCREEEEEERRGRGG